MVQETQYFVRTLNFKINDTDHYDRVDIKDLNAYVKDNAIIADTSVDFRQASFYFHSGSLAQDTDFINNVHHH